jgi:hypothetical protein
VRIHDPARPAVQRPTEADARRRKPVLAERPADGFFDLLPNRVGGRLSGNVVAQALEGRSGFVAHEEL